MLSNLLILSALLHAQPTGDPPGKTPLPGPAPGITFRTLGLDPPLTDVEAEHWRMPFTKAWLVLETPQGDRRILLSHLPPPQPGAAARLGARFTAPGPDFTAQFEWEMARGVERSTPFRVELSPPDAPTPDWAKGIVWYQIFADRFRNGNRANDQTDATVFVKPWASSWRNVGLLEWEFTLAMDVAEGRPHDRRRSALDSAMLRRRYGGDLQGVVQKLDHLQAKGVTGLYFCPIFKSYSLHRYNAADFRHIDPVLGNAGSSPPASQHDERETADPATWTWTEADRYFLDVVLPEARKRGMRVIIDGVWNHVGTDHWAFADVRKRGPGSPYASWFDVKFDASGQVIAWGSWNRPNGDLPEFARDLFTQALPAEVELHVHNITRRWMDPDADGDPSDGVDGWRLDVAAEIPHEFWIDWHALVKRINPNALSIAEIWHPATAWLQGDQFDGQMNYPFAMAVIPWVRGDRNTSSDALARHLAFARSQRPEVNLVQMTLLDSHDTERITSMMLNPDRGYDNAGRPGQRGYREEPMTDAARRRAAMAIALLMTSEGSPMIYNGNEWGMIGGDDPHNRRPIPWPDSSGHPDAKGVDFAFVRMVDPWLAIRRDPAFGQTLTLGATFDVAGGSPDVYAFIRQLDAQRLLVVANRGEAGFDASGLGVADDAIVAPLSVAIFTLPE